MTAAASASQADDESRLADLLERLTAQLRAGRWPDVEATAREHPALAEELRALWAAVLVAEGAASGQAAPTLVRDDAAQEPSAAALPRQLGDYELVEELGRGGMGVVYRARQTSLGRTVALKMIQNS